MKVARVVIHNYMTRNVGRFRATGGAHDHTGHDCGCGCGGKGDCNHDHAPAELGIDVVYEKGNATETRHYSVPVTVDPHGRAPQDATSSSALRGQAGHTNMLRDGWRVKKTEGYLKREHRDVSRQAV